jgi:hypothetical protein
MADELHLAMTGQIHEELRRLILRNAPEEEICFGLLYPSTGTTRRTLILRQLLEPMEGDREVHGNASYNAQFVNRAIDAALDAGAGLALIHSHPLGKGFQRASRNDRQAERRTLDTAFWALKGMPVASLIMGGDGTVSCREYVYSSPGEDATVRSAAATRVVGRQLVLQLREQPLVAQHGDVHLSHVGLWGATGQYVLGSLRVGVVGAGSVGSCVIEQLARLGVGDIVTLDYDRVEKKNRNRLYGERPDDSATRRRKVEVAERQAHLAATAEPFRMRGVVASVVEPDGAALVRDCDVLVSCADSHWSRQVVNAISYAHLIPVIDGGTKIKADEALVFQTASCRAQAAGPGRGCLECSGGFDPACIAEEMAGMVLPHYAGAAATATGEPSVIPLNTVLAGLEVLQFLELALGIAGVTLPRQRYDYRGGDIATEMTTCSAGCPWYDAEGTGDHLKLPLGRDPRFKDRPDTTGEEK